MLTARADAGVEHAAYHGADGGANLLGLLGGGGLAGADGPDGLVGDDAALHVLRLHAGQGGLDLVVDVLDGELLLALLKALAHADYRDDAGGDEVADLTLTSESVSPWYWRRSLWPTMQ